MSPVVNSLQEMALRIVRKTLTSLGVGRPCENHTHSVIHASWPRSISCPNALPISIAADHPLPPSAYPAEVSYRAPNSCQARTRTYRKPHTRLSDKGAVTQIDSHGNA